MGLEKEISEYRVSSVLNSDRKQFGKKYLFDGVDETCWNSDQGCPQWIQFSFPSPTKLSKLSVQFQGGFVGKECILQELDSSEQPQQFEFYPQDINSLQEFQCNPPLTSKGFKLIFKSSTDFYGRIILYHLKLE